MGASSEYLRRGAARSTWQWPRSRPSRWVIRSVRVVRISGRVVPDVEPWGEWTFERRRYGSTPRQLRDLSEWLLAQQVEEVVMESTAQYWKPVWGVLERFWTPVAQQRADA